MESWLIGNVAFWWGFTKVCPMYAKIMKKKEEMKRCGLWHSSYFMLLIILLYKYIYICVCVCVYAFYITSLTCFLFVGQTSSCCWSSHTSCSWCHHTWKRKRWRFVVSAVQCSSVDIIFIYVYWITALYKISQLEESNSKIIIE